jgi:polysaccharide deacetylase family protein (PEP-CTERM system associated)
VSLATPLPAAARSAAGSAIARPHPETGKLFLFSVDLEDIRQLVPDGDRYRDRVRTNTDRFIEFLAAHDMTASFFTTGDVARRHPGLVRDLVQAGHEIACHSSDHLPLDRHTQESFREDVKRCLDDFARAGAERCVGFRAPVGSLFAKTRWAYEVLTELGFRYSASVLAAENPLYGWPEFGPDLPQVVDGLWEIPSSLSHLPGLDVPFVGGVYYRVLPFPLIRWLTARRWRSGYPIFGYTHPYDVDTDQERFMHPEIDDNRFYNWLLYLGRSRTLPRTHSLVRSGCRIIRYDEYVEKILGDPAPAATADR